jgi:Cu(I)/Ag(I) efflux system protein CusF
MKRWMTLAAAAVVSVAALAQPAAGEGEVSKIDKAAARITIKHGGLKALDMPPMAQSFRVADAGLLDQVAVGDRVRFTAEKAPGGYTLKSLSRAR